MKKFPRSNFIVSLFVSHDLTSKSFRIYEKFSNNAKELKKFLNLITISANTMTRLGAQTSRHERSKICLTKGKLIMTVNLREIAIHQEKELFR